ncbi:hypothetical protein ACFPT7_03640 [Acidicapsa dinghuensis]|uniref:Uncharacterized protein n=1 Tax=Acidicapsa dinghuensis TaxID=2218256 RepID=A0ABW1EBT1_9BACT|nr:hypothetical protein [Acidicapsa dinghuensis]
MPTTRKAKNSPKTPSDTSSTLFNIDVVFCGPLLFVPEVQDGKIASLEVYSPCNGHPVGAIFLPGIFFSDTDLDGIESDNWPESQRFSLLDPHSYLLHLTQAGLQMPFPVTSIPDTNHKVKAGRKLSGDWHAAFKLTGQISLWSTHLLRQVSEGMYYGSDRPTGQTVASLQRLSYKNVAGFEGHGLGPQQTEYLSINSKTGGTFIVEGEIPYQPSLHHERQAIEALAKLAGLNLHLMISAPTPGRSMLQGRYSNCSNSVIVI